MFQTFLVNIPFLKTTICCKKKKNGSTLWPENEFFKFNMGALSVLLIWDTDGYCGLAWNQNGLKTIGGTNTLQPLPRIISIQPTGSAYQSHDLRVGQLISEVDGFKLSGKEYIIRTVFENHKKGAFNVYILGGQKLIKNVINSRLGEFWCGQSALPLTRQVNFNWTKLPKSNRSTTIWVIFKLC